MKRPPTVSRGLILTLPYAEIVSMVGRTLALGETFAYRIPAFFEVADGANYQPQMFARIVPASVIERRGDGLATVRLELRADA